MSAFQNRTLFQRMGTKGLSWWYITTESLKQLGNRFLVLSVLFLLLCLEKNLGFNRLKKSTVVKVNMENFPN